MSKVSFVVHSVWDLERIKRTLILKCPSLPLIGLREIVDHLLNILGTLYL